MKPWPDLTGIGKGRATSPLIDSHWLLLWPIFSPAHSMRLATVVPQPVTIRFPWVSKISSPIVSVNSFPSLLTSMIRVSLCVCIQAPAGLKMKISDTAL